MERTAARVRLGTALGTTVALVLLGAPPALAGKAVDTKITSGPAAVTTSTSATFAFSATVSGATFACRLDGAAATPCTSPTTYAGLAGGAHAFSVAATAG
ncbi:MAG: hypothetical protein ACXVYC_21600, partial [Blastococcus sp.]